MREWQPEQAWLFTGIQISNPPNQLDHLLDHLDGSYLHCDKRISDAGPADVIWFDDARKTFLQTYLKTEAKPYAEALEHTAAMIDGFESPFGMALLATVGHG